MIAESNEDPGFTRSRGCFDEVVGWLGAAEAGELEHAELEDRLEVAGRDRLRRLLQDHLDLRAQREARLADVVDVHGVRHGTVEDGHGRRLGTVFGPVTVSRLAYRHRGHHNLYPADAALNLPTERHSHGLRRLAAAQASRGSFDEAAAALERATGQHLGKRQVEALAGPGRRRRRRVLNPRTLLHPLPAAATRPRPTQQADRYPRQPRDPHR